MPIPVSLTPPPSRERGLLLQAARNIPDESYAARGGERRWPMEGVTWNPSDFTPPAAVEAQCDTTWTKDPDELDDLVTQEAFMLWRSLQCSNISGAMDLLEDRVNYSLDELRSFAFAAELETAAASGGLGLIGNATYPPTLVNGTAGQLAQVIPELEAFLASELSGAVGYIHLRADLLAAAFALDLIYWDGDVYRTPTGHIVVGDAGFTGQATPQGQSAPGGGEAWVYASSTIWFDETAIQFVRSVVDGNTEVHFLTNKDRPLGERSGILVFDPHVVGVALADLTSIL